MNFLTRVWNDFAPAIGNHLWQSTIFAAALAAITLAFRNNRARTRYWLWLAASLKFLFRCFSLLVSAGSYLATPHAQTATKAAYYAAFEQFGQPFAGDDVASFARSTPATTAGHPATHYLPLLLLVWLIGTIVVLAVWIARWCRVSAIAKSATPLHEGPEATIVAQLQDGDAPHDKVEIVSTGATIEPGIFGIFRPVLLWPASISGQLTKAHTESIVAHELCHVRRRDNLTATLHMLVESLFWFHPAVWWLGNRLVEDRERACDESVVESGREPHVYAESILKVCEFCVESPLPCVPGVSGADLKRRIASIMSHRRGAGAKLGTETFAWRGHRSRHCGADSGGCVPRAFKTERGSTDRHRWFRSEILVGVDHAEHAEHVESGGVTLMFSSDQFIVEERVASSGDSHGVRIGRRSHCECAGMARYGQIRFRGDRWTGDGW